MKKIIVIGIILIYVGIIMGLGNVIFHALSDFQTVTKEKYEYIDTLQ